MNEYTVEQIEAIGGKRWTKNDGTVRVYLNYWWEAAGLEIEKYKTGNVKSAALLGHGISNRAGTYLSGAKIYWENGILHTEDLATRVDREDYSGVGITGADVAARVTTWVAERVTTTTAQGLGEG